MRGGAVTRNRSPAAARRFRLTRPAIRYRVVQHLRERGGDISKGPRPGVKVFFFLGTLLLAAASFGQNPLPSGNLYGTALDEQQKSLPGVRASLAGPGAAQAVTTDAKGDFHFLNISPGAYSVTLERK